jgi:hypothetical protein
MPMAMPRLRTLGGAFIKWTFENGWQRTWTSAPGVPFALSGGRRGALSGVVVALVIAVTYVLTSSLFEAMGNVSQLPPLIAAWSPDLIFGLAGGYLTMKTPS